MMQLTKVDYIYPSGQRALQNIDLRLDQMGCIGLIGPSGAGKSTLFSLLLGTMKPTKGNVSMNGEALKYNRSGLHSHFSKVGMVFQNPEDQLVASLVYDEVAYGYRNRGMDLHKEAEVVTMALEAVGLLGYQNRNVHGLSFGEKKRVAIAGQLVMGHRLLLLDEPSAGLDYRATQQMCDVVRGLIAKGQHIVIASHDMDLIYALCSRVLLLTEGKLLADDTAKQVFSQRELLEASGLYQPFAVRQSHCPTCTQGI